MTIHAVIHDELLFGVYREDGRRYDTIKQAALQNCLKAPQLTKALVGLHPCSGTRFYTRSMWNATHPSKCLCWWLAGHGRGSSREEWDGLCTWKFGFGYKKYLLTETWHEIRRSVLDRDSSKCVICGFEAEAIHHVIYNQSSLWGDYLWNMISICNGCHMKCHKPAYGKTAMDVRLSAAKTVDTMRYNNSCMGACNLAWAKREFAKWQASRQFADNVEQYETILSSTEPPYRANKRYSIHQASRLSRIDQACLPEDMIKKVKKAKTEELKASKKAHREVEDSNRRGKHYHKQRRARGGGGVYNPKGENASPLKEVQSPEETRIGRILENYKKVELFANELSIKSSICHDHGRPFINIHSSDVDDLCLVVGSIAESFGTPYMKLMGMNYGIRVYLACKWWKEKPSTRIYKKQRKYNRFKIIDCVKEPRECMRLIYGYGINDSEGPHTFICPETGKKIRERHNLKWAIMQGRCLSERIKREKPAYRDAHYCPEWRWSSVFEPWSHEQERILGMNIRKLELDKDIFGTGDSLYSPETCVYVTKNMNNFFKGNKRNPENAHLPVGVYLHHKRRTPRYQVQLKGQHVGIFGSIEEAKIVSFRIRREYITEEVKDWPQEHVKQKILEKMNKHYPE